MKKIYLLLSIALVAVLTACNPDNDTPQVSEDYITLNASIMLPKKDNSKTTGLPENAVDGWYEYEWDGTKNQTLWVLFQSGATKAVQKVTFQVPTGYHPTNKPHPITIEIRKPAGFEDINDFTIMGAFGIASMDNTGKCTINPPASIDGTNKNYDLPFYFAPTQVKDNRVNNINFKTYGSLMRVVVHGNPDTTTPINFTKLSLKTSVFAIKGTFDITTASATTDPTWTTVNTSSITESVTTKFNGDNDPTNIDYIYTSRHTYELTGVTADNTQKGVFYIWGYPDLSVPSYTEHNHQNMNHYRRNIFFDIELSGGKVLPNSIQTKEKWETKKTYSMHAPFVKTGTLIFTEFVHFQSSKVFFELYNPTNNTIDLRDYALYDEKNDQWVYFDYNPYALLDCDIPHPTYQVEYLEPGGILVIYSRDVEGLPGNGATFWHNNKVGYRRVITRRADLYPERTYFGYRPFEGNFYIIYKDPVTNTNVVIDTFAIAPSGTYGRKRVTTDNTPSPVYKSSNWSQYSSAWFNAELGIR